MHFRNVLSACLIFVNLSLAAQSARAEVKIVDPWPDPASIVEIVGQHVTFSSISPFDPRDIADARERKPAQVNATLFMPPDATATDTVPAVVMLHGASGVQEARELTYGPQLAAMGIAALAVDTYGSRRDLAETFIGRALRITETMFVSDAYAGLAYLAANPAIDAHRVVLAGFSYGGMAATYALYRQLADALAPGDLRFVGHVAFYGPCIAHFDDDRTTGVPLLMLQGADDILLDPKRCEAVADELRAGGSKVAIVRYPGAVHQWDGGWARRTIGRNLAPCRFTVEKNGLVRDDRTGLPMSNPILRGAILALCTGGPFPIGRDDAVRAQSNRDFGAFLAQAFAKPHG